MHDDREQVPGHHPTGLPPFSARSSSGPPPVPGSARPLPPWSSEGRTLDGESEGTPPEPEEASWTAGEVELPPETREEAPAPPAAATDAFADEPWPGLESAEEIEPATGGPVGEPWAAAPESGDEPWAAEPAAEPEPEPWVAEGAAESESEPWAPEDAEPAPLVLDEVESSGPWAEEEIETSESAPAAPSPLDELVDVAGEALSGANAWTEAPLGTWPGEAEAWDAVALTGDSQAEASAADAEIAGMADALERLAADVRARGESALEPGSRDALDAALASFLAGWRAARRGG